MIFWILHKKTKLSDLYNKVEGTPSLFYQLFSSFRFVDISEYPVSRRIENRILGLKYLPDFDELGINKKAYILIKRKRDAVKLIRSVDPQNDIFIFQKIEERSSLWSFLLLLNRYKIHTALINNWQLPLQERRKSYNLKTLVTIWNQDKRLFICKSLRFLSNYKKPKNQGSFDFSLSSGWGMIEEVERSGHISIKKIIPVHSVSYDEFLDERTHEKKLITTPYFVFVDQALFIHPDNKEYNFTERDLYLYHNEIHKALRFFSQENNGCKIVIAQHPRIQYERGFWDGFEVYNGVTANLIKFSEGVIGHFSTSLNLAFLFEKKICLFTSSSSWFPFSLQVSQYRSLLHCSMIDMNTLQKCKIKINRGKYTKAFLTKYYTLLPDDGRSNKDLFTKFLSNYSEFQEYGHTNRLSGV